MKKAILASLLALAAAVTAAASAHAGALLRQDDLKYQGAFKVPWTRQGCEDWTDCVFGYGGQLIAFNPTGDHGRGSLFLGGNIQAQKVAEIGIPPLVKSKDLDALKTVRVLQYFHDPTEGHQKELLAGGRRYGETVNKGGLLVYGDKLVGTVYTYYPGETQILSHYTASLNLSRKGSFRGMYQVGTIPARMVGGYLGAVPSSWQSALGGTVLTGQAALPIISTTSAGPSVSVFDPADLGVKEPAPAAALLYYPITHPLAAPDKANPLFTLSSSIRGVVFPEGTDSVLFFGSNGAGDYCYGEQTRDPKLHKKEVPGSPGDSFCYDPANSFKGPHMYPYRYQVWAYDAKDLLLVKAQVTLSASNRTANTDPSCPNGTTIKPWCVTPYAVWNFTLPFQPPNSELLGAAYDPATQRIFISQNALNSPPVIHVFKVSPKAEPSRTPLQR